MSDLSPPQASPETAPSPALTSENCRDYLRVVIDPEIFANIVELGLVYDVIVHPDDGVEVIMTLTTPHCPMGPQIIENVEKTLLGHGARTVHVRIVWEPMWTPASMTEELQRELGIIPDEDEIEPELEIEPPPPPKKKSLLGRLFGR